MKQLHRRVVVTGLGILSPIGNTVEDAWISCVEGKSGITTVDIEDHAGRRIDNYLFNIYRSLPKSKIYSMIRKGEIRVNSGRVKPTHKLQLNDEIRIPPYLIED